MTRLILEIGNFLNGKQESGYDILASLPKVMDFKDFVTKKPLLYHVVKVRPVFLDRRIESFQGFVRKELAHRSKFLRRKVHINHIDILKYPNTIFCSDLQTVQKTVYFRRDDSNAKEKQKTLSEKIENIEEVIIFVLYQNLDRID